MSMTDLFWGITFFVIGVAIIGGVLWLAMSDIRTKRGLIVTSSPRTSVNPVERSEFQSEGALNKPPALNFSLGFSGNARQRRIVRRQQERAAKLGVV